MINKKVSVIMILISIYYVLSHHYILEYNLEIVLPSDFLKSLQCTIIIFLGTYINSWQ